MDGNSNHTCQVFDKMSTDVAVVVTPGDSKEIEANDGSEEEETEFGERETEYEDESSEHERETALCVPSDSKQSNPSQVASDFPDVVHVDGVKSLMANCLVGLNLKNVDGVLNFQSGVSRKSSKLIHCMLEKMPQRSFEAKIKANASQVQDMTRIPQTRANVAATNGISRLYTGELRLYHWSVSGSRLEYFAPKDPGVINIEDNLINEQPWKTCLVGYFLEENFVFGRVGATTMSL
ncbi:hypothetical protein U1Q18_025697 [Sarracenia purpurea var. burkii]